jgi:hypothetical protein
MPLEISPSIVFRLTFHQFDGDIDGPISRRTGELGMPLRTAARSVHLHPPERAGPQASIVVAP